MSAAIVEMKLDEYRRREDELDVLRARVAKLEAALTMLQSYGCPICQGDCASANPPVLSCPMLECRAALKDAPK